MGRPKEYEREDLVAKATDLFRTHGYGGTSTQMLVDELGVNKKSLYSEFGNKQGLFDACLEHYDGLNVENNFGPLEQPGANLEQIRALFEFFAAAYSGPAGGRGCLLCNTAVEFGPNDPSGHEFVQRYFARISSSFVNALTNAKRGGRLKRGVDVELEAQSFTASVLGMFVMLRAKAKPKLLKGAAAAAIQRLEDLGK
jgi:TetR/AcrR family transcriptional repressor of nem operon